MIEYKPREEKSGVVDSKDMKMGQTGIIVQAKVPQNADSVGDAVIATSNDSIVTLTGKYAGAALIDNYLVRLTDFELTEKE